MAKKLKKIAKRAIRKPVILNKTTGQAVKPPPVKSIVQLASPPNTIPLVVHDPVKNLVTIAHVEPEQIGWMEWLFGSGRR